MLRITNEARAELERFNKTELCNEEFLRISRAYQCGGSKFQLIVDESRTAMDEVITLDGLELVVERTCLNLLQNSELDFNGEGFLFIDDFGNAC